MTTCQPCNEVNRRPTYFDGIHFEFLALTTFSPSSTRRTASTPANYLVRNSTLVHSHFANSIFLPCRPSARGREHARRTPRKGGKRGETKKSMALPNVVAQFWRIKVFSNRLTVESTHPHPLPPSLIRQRDVRIQGWKVYLR